MKGTRSGSFYDRSGAILKAMVSEGLIKPQEGGEGVEDAKTDSRRFKSRSISPSAASGPDLNRLLNDAGDGEFINPETRDLGSDAIGWRELVQRKDRYIDALMHRTAKLVSKFVDEAEKLQADLNRQRKERGILEEKVKELQYYVDKAPARAAMLALRNIKTKNALTNEGFGMLESLPVGGMTHHSTLVLETAENLDDNFQRTAFIAAMREQEDKIAELEALLAKEKEQGSKMLKRFDVENLRYKIALGTMTRLTVVTKRLEKDVKEDDFLGSTRKAAEWKEYVQELLKVLQDVMNAKDASERDRGASKNLAGGPNALLDETLPEEEPGSPGSRDDPQAAFLTETSGGKVDQSLATNSRVDAKLAAFAKKKFAEDKSAKAKSGKGAKGGKGKPLDMLDLLKGKPEDKETGKEKPEPKEGVSYVWSQLAVAREKLRGLKSSIIGVRKDVAVLQTSMQYWIFGIVNQVSTKISTIPPTRRESERFSIYSLQSSCRRGTIVTPQDLQGISSSSGAPAKSGHQGNRSGKQVTMAGTPVSGEVLEKILEERKEVIRRKSLAASLHKGELHESKGEADGTTVSPSRAEEKSVVDRRRQSVGPSLLSNVATYTSTSATGAAFQPTSSSIKPLTSGRSNNDIQVSANQRSMSLSGSTNPPSVSVPAPPSGGGSAYEQEAERSDWTEEERVHAEQEVENLKKELDSVKAEKAEIQVQRQQLVELLKQRQEEELIRERAVNEAKPMPLNPDMLLIPHSRQRSGKSPSKHGTRVGLALHSVDVDKQDVPLDSPGQVQVQFNKLKEAILKSESGDFTTTGPGGSQSSFSVGGSTAKLTGASSASGSDEKPLPKGGLSPQKPQYPWLTGSQTPRSHHPTSTKKATPLGRQQSSNAQDFSRPRFEGAGSDPLSTEHSFGGQSHGENYGSLYPVSNVLPTQVRVVAPVDRVSTPSARSARGAEGSAAQSQDTHDTISPSATSASSCRMCHKETAQYCIKCLLVAASSHILSPSTGVEGSTEHDVSDSHPPLANGQHPPPASTNAPTMNPLNPDDLLQALEKELNAREQQVRDKEVALTRKVSVSFVKWVGKGQVPPPDVHSIRYRTTKEDVAEDGPALESPRDGQQAGVVPSPSSNTKKAFIRRVKAKDEQNLQVSGLNLPPIRPTFLPTPTAGKAKTPR